MFFPIGDDQVRGGHKPIFSYILLGINVMVFAFETTLDGQSLANFTYTFGAIPDHFLHGEHLISLVTGLFLHGGWAHLLGNMLFLWVFADNVEATIGSMKFLVFFILGGIASTIFHGLIFPDSSLPLIGASGAIAAVLGAYLIMFPHSRIKVLVLILFTSFNVPALLFLGFWIITQFFDGYGSLGAVSAEGAGIAYWAHVGGFLFGVVVGYYAKKTYNPRLITEEENKADQYV